MRLYFIIFLFIAFISSDFALARKPSQDYDKIRLKQLTIMARMIEYFHSIKGYYPLKPASLGDVNVSYISSTPVKKTGKSLPHELLQDELFDALGSKAVLFMDPEDGEKSDGTRYFKYETNGQSYSLSVYLRKRKQYSKMEGVSFNKVTISSRPNVDRLKYTVRFIEKYGHRGHDNGGLQISLFKALKQDNFLWAQELISDGANVNPICRRSGSCLPLSIAAGEGDIEAMEFLLKNRADIDAPDKNYDVALMKALGNEKYEAAKLLVKTGANLNIPNKSGITPFLMAIRLQNIELIKLMLDKVVNINDHYLKSTYTSATGEINVRPLEIAVNLQNIELVKLLLSKGADPTLSTTKEVDIILYAKALESIEIVKLLEEAALKKKQH